MSESIDNLATEQCGGCKFWLVFPVDAEAGFKRGTCRRFPPVIDPLVVQEELRNLAVEDNPEPAEDCTEPIYWRHPSTFEEDWCGEFKA